MGCVSRRHGCVGRGVLARYPPAVTTLQTLDGRRLAADAVPPLFPGAWWHEVLHVMRKPRPPVIVIDGALRVDDLEPDDGAWALIVQGDLEAAGDLDFSTGDYQVSLLVVLGSVRARNFRFAKGATCVIAGDLDVSGHVVGRYGDESARLEVGGVLRARALLLDHVTGAEAAIDAIVVAGEGWRLPLDAPMADEERRIYAPAVLDDEDRLDLAAAWGAATRGEPIFLPDAEARLRRPAPWRPSR